MKPACSIFMADDGEDARFMLSHTLDKAGLGWPVATFAGALLGTLGNLSAARAPIPFIRVS